MSARRGGFGRAAGGAGGPMPFDLRPTPMVLRLILINLGVWFFFSILVNFAHLDWALALYRDWLSLDPMLAVFGLRPWTMFTYMWLHDLNGASHIIFNMLGLFFLGPALERRWGPKPFLQFWILSGLIAGVLSTVAGLVAPGLFGARVVGASGAVMAVLAAFSFVMPNAVLLLMFVLPVQARWVIWIAVGIDTVMWVAAGGQSEMAYHTHMGGVAAAWLLITGHWRPRLLLDRWRLARMKSKRDRGRPDLRVLDGGRSSEDRRYLN